MTCYYLRPAWRDSQENKNGKKEITFAKKGSQIDEHVMVPCGKCEGCRAAARQDWAIRMYHESQSFDRNSFVTLTYENSPERLIKSDLQKFIKRLRKHSNRQLRYFACGEYGEETNRPHYHMILFNEDFRGGYTYNIDDQLYGNSALNRIWSHGTCTLSDFSMATACYVAGYVNKKLGDEDTFNIMSKRPPIGYDYAVKHQDELARLETCVIEGRQLPIPKVYLQWDQTTKFRKETVHLDTVSGNRRKYLKELTPQQLRNKELSQKATQKLKVNKL